MNFFWPKMKDTHAASRICDAASGVAFFMAIATAALVWLQLSDKFTLLPGVGVWGYWDAAVFAVIGIGLHFHSRLAAVAGVLFFAAEKMVMFYINNFQIAQVVTAVIFILAFVNGARGAFAWHILRKAELAAAGDVSSPPPQQVPVKKGGINLIRPLILLVVLVGVAGAAFYYLKSNKEVLSAFEPMNKKLKIAQAHLPKMPSAPVLAPKGEIVKLMLKTGRKFEGVLIKKNAVGYWLFIEGTGEVFFSVGEIKEVS